MKKYSTGVSLITLALMLVAGILLADYITGIQNLLTDYSSQTGQIPDEIVAQEAVSRCEKTKRYGEKDFNSSWRFSGTSENISFFYCDIEEKIDWRERSRLAVDSLNPPERHSWTVGLEF